jgi:hypothetical protein
LKATAVIFSSEVWNTSIAMSSGTLLSDNVLKGSHYNIGLRCRSFMCHCWE